MKVFVAGGKSGTGIALARLLSETPGIVVVTEEEDCPPALDHESEFNRICIGMEENAAFAARARRIDTYQKFYLSKMKRKKW